MPRRPPAVRRLGLCLLLLTTAAASQPAGSLDTAADFDGPTTCQRDQATDGDSIRATCDGRRVRIRLTCMDAPELAQRPHGVEARDLLRRLTPPTFTLIPLARDRWGRIVATVRDPVTGADIGLQGVARGVGALDPRYCDSPHYRFAEAAARALRIGIWATPGDHQRPWEYRARRP